MLHNDKTSTLFSFLLFILHSRIYTALFILACILPEWSLMTVLSFSPLSPTYEGPSSVPWRLHSCQSFHEHGPTVSVDFFIIILTALGHIFPPPFLWMDSRSLAWHLVVDLCIWFHELLEEFSSFSGAVDYSLVILCFTSHIHLWVGTSIITRSYLQNECDIHQNSNDIFHKNSKTILNFI